MLAFNNVDSLSLKASEGFVSFVFHVKKQALTIVAMQPLANTNDRYLNVQYGSTLTAEVNITGISRLGGVKSAIKRELSNALSQVDAPQLQLYTNSNRDQLINTWALLDSLPQE